MDAPGGARSDPGEAHGAPRAARPEGKGQEETRADKTSGRTGQQADKRSSGATKPRTPWPISNLLLVHLMHGSTLVSTYVRPAGWRGFCGFGSCFSILQCFGTVCNVLEWSNCKIWNGLQFWNGAVTTFGMVCKFLYPAGHTADPTCF